MAEFELQKLKLQRRAFNTARGLHRNAYPEAGSPFRFGLYFDFAVVLFDDLIGNKETQPGAFAALGRKKEGKQAFAGLAIHSNTVVSDFENNIIFVRLKAENDLMGFFSRIFDTGIQCVFEDIYQRQAHHPGIHLDLSQASFKIARQSNAGGFYF